MYNQPNLLYKPLIFLIHQSKVNNHNTLRHVQRPPGPGSTLLKNDETNSKSSIDL